MADRARPAEAGDAEFQGFATAEPEEGEANSRSEILHVIRSLLLLLAVVALLGWLMT